MLDYLSRVHTRRLLNGWGQRRYLFRKPGGGDPLATRLKIVSHRPTVPYTYPTP